MSSEKPVVLVTGASSGFGKVTSGILAQNGYRVFGTSRDPSKVKDGPKNVEMLELDVKSDDSVSGCVNSLLSKTNGRIDVLINNAGVVMRGAIEEMTLEEMKDQLETNLFGYLRMIKAVLPTMRQRKRGKIINVGSMAGHITVPFEGMYCVSKFALEAVSEQLRYETKNLGISVSVVEPGFFKTNLFVVGGMAKASIDDYREAKTRALTKLREFDENGGDPIFVAKEILKIVRTDKPKLHYPVGKETSGLIYKRLLPESVFENGLMRRFNIDKVNS